MDFDECLSSVMNAIKEVNKLVPQDSSDVILSNMILAIASAMAAQALATKQLADAFERMLGTTEEVMTSGGTYPSRTFVRVANYQDI